jgi:pimeloyl-ACP methyl ester carboxylesterase
LPRERTTPDRGGSGEARANTDEHIRRPIATTDLTKIFAGRTLLKGSTVMDRLGEIKVPTLVMAGRDDFLFSLEHQVELAAGIPNASLEIIEGGDTMRTRSGPTTSRRP